MSVILTEFPATIIVLRIGTSVVGVTGATLLQMISRLDAHPRQARSSTIAVPVHMVHGRHLVQTHSWCPDWISMALELFEADDTSMGVADAETDASWGHSSRGDPYCNTYG